MHTAFDTTQHATDQQLDALVVDGAKGGSRYIAAGGNYKLTDRAEIDRFHARGLKVFLNFEEFGDRVGAFSAAQGKLDATRALKNARDVLGAPKGCAIYFSCEPDQSKGAYNEAQAYASRVLPYYAEAQQVLGDQYRVGAYTFGTWWLDLLKRRIIDFPWHPGAPGWSGYRQGLASNLWAMRQLTPAEHGLEQNFHGLQVDWDAINPTFTDVGAWEPGGELQPVPAPVPHLPIRRGMIGPDVARIQAKLGIPADEAFGPQTYTAVVAFQKANGLFPDGVVGPLTWGKLQL